jgi:hypothetical protein
MNSEDYDLEDNIARLIRAGYGPEVRPDPRVREKTFEYLVSQLRSENTLTEFPACTLGLLFCALVLMAIWLATQMVGVYVGITSLVPQVIIAATLFVNLASVPVAAIIIVKRRRHVQL